MVLAVTAYLAPMNPIPLLHATRKNIRGLLLAHTPEQMNTLPEGFNNNLIWNAGHVIATCELLTYALSGQRTPSGKEFINRYRKGTRPEGTVGQEEIDYIARELLEGVDRLERAVGQGSFTTFKPYQTSFGVELQSIEDALSFNTMHEAMHLGTMLGIRKLV